MESVTTWIPKATLDKWLKEEKEFEKEYKMGMAKAASKYVKILLLKTDLSVIRIAEIVEVTPYFVRKIKKSLKTSDTEYHDVHPKAS
jgi:hypothetical protein